MRILESSESWFRFYPPVLADIPLIEGDKNSNAGRVHPLNEGVADTVGGGIISFSN